MRKTQQQEITVENVINNYQKLTSNDPETKFQANLYLCQLPRRDQAWMIAQNIITQVQNTDYQFIGCQVLYQKFCMEMRTLTPDQLVQLRMFIFTKLQEPTINSVPCIDKLASVGALIGCLQIFTTWPNFINDLFNFMSNSQHNLKSGLFVLERIPQQLRATNRIGAGQKNIIIQQILKNETLMAQAFVTILNMNNPSLQSKCLQAIQSWAKSQFNFLKYPEIIRKVLNVSEQKIDKFQLAASTTVQSIKGAVINKQLMMSSSWSPAKQLEGYVASQIQSIKEIIQYLVNHRKYFTGKEAEPEHVEGYLGVIKQSLLNFGFLIAQPIGFQLLNIIKELTKSQDLRTSQSTFEFWMDFMSKMAKCKIQVQIKNQFIICVNEIFQIISKKVAVNSQQLLFDPDLKEQVTIDDLNAMSWDEYRKLSVDFYQSIYEYFLQASGSAHFYFERCFEFIGNQQKTETLGPGTQLALFCVKAPIQSMISEADAQSICKLIRFVINKGDKVYPRIIVQALLLIRDCTRQMKRDSGLIKSALNYAMSYLNNEKINFYASEAFKSLVQTAISDRTLVQQLLIYYGSQTFSNEHIVDKIIQGICTAIMKMENPEDINIFITQLAQIVLARFETAYKNLKPGDNRPFFVSMLQMKTILDNFQISGKELSKKLPQYSYLYYELLKNSLKMVLIVLPYCLKERINYVKFNELGLSCSMYKLALNICQNQIQPQFLSILNQTLVVLTKQDILQKYPLMELLCHTMTHFVNKNSNQLNNWLMNQMPGIDNFYMDYIKQIALADADVVRSFFEIQESLVLYNCKIFLSINNPQQIFDAGLYILRHLNQTKMQRKVINFLLVCCSNHPTIFSFKFPQVIQTIIASIPIISGVSVHNISRMFLIASQGFPNMRQFLNNKLQLNPYEGLSQAVIKQLVNLIMLTIQPSSNVQINIKQRCLMMIIKQLSELAKNPELPNKALQLQMRYNDWKRNKFVTNDED